MLFRWQRSPEGRVDVKPFSVNLPRSSPSLAAGAANDRQKHGKSSEFGGVQEAEVLEIVTSHFAVSHFLGVGLGLGLEFRVRIRVKLRVRG